MIILLHRLLFGTKGTPSGVSPGGTSYIATYLSHGQY